METVTNNIFKKSLELREQGYTELPKTDPYKNCNSIFINKYNRTFWFTTKETAEHTLQVAQSKFKIAS